MTGKRGSIVTERKYWVLLGAAMAVAFWVVALGVGWRAWILAGSPSGIVAHVDAFGQDAMPWMVTAAILTLTAATLGVGLAIVRRLAEGPGTRALAELEPKEPLEPLPKLPELRGSATAERDDLVAASPMSESADPSDGDAAGPLDLDADVETTDRP